MRFGHSAGEHATELASDAIVAQSTTRKQQRFHMKSISARFSFLIPLAIALGACESAPRSAPKAAPAASQPAAVTAKPAPQPAPKPAAAAATPALVLTPQKGWIVEQPASPTRKAQYSLPHADGDSEDASLIVHHFGGQGGSREANVQRWVSQFEQPDGSSSADKLKSLTRTIAGLEVFDAELSGTYVAETAPGSGIHVNKPGWRMLASIVETKDGPWYFKLVGPAATLAKWEPSYQAFMMALKPGG